MLYCKDIFTKDIFTGRHFWEDEKSRIFSQGHFLKDIAACYCDTNRHLSEKRKEIIEEKNYDV